MTAAGHRRGRGAVLTEDNPTTGVSGPQRQPFMLFLSRAKESGLFLKPVQMPNNHERRTTKEEADVPRVKSNVHEEIRFLSILYAWGFASSFSFFLLFCSCP